jgi:hypothetical protein
LKTAGKEKPQSTGQMAEAFETLSFDYNNILTSPPEKSKGGHGLRVAKPPGRCYHEKRLGKLI